MLSMMLGKYLKRKPSDIILLIDVYKALYGGVDVEIEYVVEYLLDCDLTKALAKGTLKEGRYLKINDCCTFLDNGVHGDGRVLEAHVRVKDSKYTVRLRGVDKFGTKINNLVILSHSKENIDNCNKVIKYMERLKEEYND